jgi:protein-tyrosine phosphatase
MSTAGEPAGGERRIVLQGAYNFRDIGGYVGLDGRTVRPGLVFRSDHPGDLTDADLAEVTGFGIRTVCDMRREPERTGAPSRLEGLPGVTVHHLAIGGEAAQRYAYTARMLAGEIRSFTVAEVVDVYVRLLREFPESVGAAVELIGTAERLPLLVHCTAGKDRTAR